MNNQNENNSIFENSNVENINQTVNNEPPMGSEVKVEENVVKPVVDRPDLADKTINAVENFVNTEDHKSEYNELEVKQNKTPSLLTYIPLVSLYYILSGKYKNSEYLKFHVNQGLNITILTVIVFFISETINMIFSRNSLVLNSTPVILSFIIYTLYFVIFLGILFGVINTSNGNSKELPLIGKIKLLK